MPSTGSAVRGGFAGTPSPGCRALTLAPGRDGLDEDGVLAVVDLLLMLRYARQELPPQPAAADEDAPVPAVQY